MAVEGEYKVMPNAPKTPTRTIRVPDDIWNAVQAKAKEQGVTVTSVILKSLNDFLVDKSSESEEDSATD